MSTKTKKPTETHDEMILESTRWAESLGYEVVDFNLGRKTGADAIFQNFHREQVLLEVVTGSSFKKLLKKKRITEALKNEMVYGLIVVGDRINLLKDHGKEVGLPTELFEYGHQKQKVFGVRTIDFRSIVPVLLVSILGTRGSPGSVRVVKVSDLPQFGFSL